MKNIELSQKIFRALAAQGLSEVVVCAGARNAPLVGILSACENLKVYSFFEERSAGFFALGRAQVSRSPVAVVTTSGTAVAELLPAMIEAEHQGVPLVAVSADRPRSYRGSGSPQSIVQPGLFSHFIERDWDIEGEFDGEFLWSRRRPVHVNVCFDEPLLDQVCEKWSVKAIASPAPENRGRKEKPVAIAAKKPLVILSGLNVGVALELVPLLQKWGRPVWAEGTSKLRRHPGLSELEILGGERSLKNMDFDGVIRIGGVPTLRFWRDLETSSLPLWNFSELPYSGTARERRVGDLNEVFDLKTEFQIWSGDERARDREEGQRLLTLFEKFPLSEPALVATLSRRIEKNARVFLGNSLPIREWDLAAQGPHADVHANRGVNGIDGLFSTFYGLADALRPNWCVVGDLSALYDLSGPWALRQREIAQSRIVIINNGGGKIFERIFKNPLFENRHEIEFSGFAQLWKLPYRRVTDLNKEISFEPQLILEVIPCAEQTAAFWKAWDA